MVKVILILFLLILTSCKNTPNANYLFLVVEHFNSKTIYCNYGDDDVQRSGFETICNEFNKFTHVYTTSIQGLPALSSLLTGLYPYESHVRANTQNFLSTDKISFVELAKKNYDYSTFFISGGQPLFRKGGIHQGFDFFEDHITSDKDMRSFKENLNIFLETLEFEKNKSHLSMIHISDLKYPFKMTQNEYGEIRNLTYDSQLEEVDETLNKLFKELKRRKLWDNTKIFIIGLNGHPDSEFNLEFPHLSLKSDNSQIGFYFKDIKRNSITEKPQTINKTLSLRDIGKFLLNSFKKKKKNLISFENFDIDKINNLSDSEPDYKIIESSWAMENSLGNIRSAIVDENQLFIYDKTNKIYNKLSDNNELYSQPINNILEKKILKYTDFLLSKDFKSFSQTDDLKDKIQEIKWLKSDIYSKKNRSEFYDFFALLHFIESKNIPQIQAIIEKYPFLKNEPCLNHFPDIYKDPSTKKNCQDPLSRLFLNSLSLGKHDARSIRFQNEITDFNTIKIIYTENLKLNLDYFNLNDFKLNKIKSYILLARP
ncbi:MAG: sulfatase-like hydrolase/transferase [Bdellovibrionales bacterium]|nr:sulfatase-like hydrolase/transferase [Bdellovibrionales bacterium]